MQQNNSTLRNEGINAKEGNVKMHNMQQNLLPCVIIVVCLSLWEV